MHPRLNGVPFPSSGPSPWPRINSTLLTDVVLAWTVVNDSIFDRALGALTNRGGSAGSLWAGFGDCDFGFGCDISTLGTGA